MTSIATSFFNQIGRFSILYTIAAPIYIFASGEYKKDNGDIDGPKLAIAILITFVILTTLQYWKAPKKNFKWKILDRLTAISIMIITAIYGEDEAKAFFGAAVYFYLLGYSAGWKDHNSIISHVAFRFFGSAAVLMYVVDKSPWNQVFLLLNFLIVLGLVFTSVKSIKNHRQYNRKEEIHQSVLIF